MMNARLHKRLDLSPVCTLTVEGRRVPCKVHNVSAGGVRVTPEARRGLAAGVPVTVEFDAFGVFDAEVVWAADGNAGLRFKNSPDEMAKIVETMALYGLG